MLSSGLAAPTPSLAENPELLNQLQALQCSDDIAIAKAVLDKLWIAHSSQYLFPDELMNANKTDSQLYAGSLDIALDVLLETLKKHPDLQPQIERTFLQWNYCDVFSDGKFYDLHIVDGKLKKTEANYQPPLDWRGFRRLGFLSAKATYSPKLLRDSPLGDRAFENFFHRIYRSHCFPHPDTSEMFYKKRRALPKRISKVVKAPENTRYPYLWNKDCKTDNADIEVPLVIFKDSEEPEAITEEKKTVEIIPTVPTIVVITPPVAPVVSLPTSKQEPVSVPEKEPEPSLSENLLSDELRYAYRDASRYTDANTSQTNKYSKASKNKDNLQNLLSNTHHLDPAETSIKNAFVTGPVPKLNLSVFEPKPKVAPPTVPSANIPSGSSAAILPTIISENPKQSSGFSGGVFLTHSLGSHSTSVGGAINWKPIKDSYWNIRLGGSYDLNAKNDPFSYSWGFGYSDWHPGTISYQINNYGPIKPGEGLAFDKAIANIGYSVKSAKLDELNLGLSGSIDIPIKGDPALNAGLQWSPKENWFIRAGINQPLNGGNPSWSYSFGYSDWRPNKINFSYSNYGPNELFDTNFKENGTLNINYNWEF